MSRQSSLIYSRMWLSGTMQEILYDHSKETFTVAVYLMTTPHAHMCGLYYLPFAEIGEHCNLSAVEVDRCMGELEALGFCQYDHQVKVVWVTNMWRYQIGDPIKPQDHKCTGTMKRLKALPVSPLVNEFLISAGMKPLDQAPYPSPVPKPQEPFLSPSPSLLEVSTESRRRRSRKKLTGKGGKS